MNKSVFHFFLKLHLFHSTHYSRYRAWTTEREDVLYVHVRRRTHKCSQVNVNESFHEPLLAPIISWVVGLLLGTPLLQLNDFSQHKCNAQIETNSRPTASLWSEISLPLDPPRQTDEIWLTVPHEGALLDILPANKHSLINISVIS